MPNETQHPLYDAELYLDRMIPAGDKHNDWLRSVAKTYARMKLEAAASEHGKADHASSNPVLDNQRTMSR